MINIHSVIVFLVKLDGRFEFDSITEQKTMESVRQKLDMMELTATDLGSVPGRPKRTTNTGWVAHQVNNRALSVLVHWVQN